MSGIARVLCFIAVGAGAFPALAWNDAGHMLAALVAYDRLSADARAAAVELLSHHPRYRDDFLARMPSGVARGTPTERDRWLFATASTWPDLARTFENVPQAQRAPLVARYNHPRWHYINQPLFLDDAERDALQPIATNDALTLPAGTKEEDMNLVQALLHVEHTLSNAGAARRAVALCWLLHRTADLHHPLHTVALYTRSAFPEGDRGGNLISVGERETLHGVWDGAAARDRRWGSVLKAFASMPATSLPGDREPDFAAWARAGRDLAARVVYAPAIRDAVRGSTLPPGSTIRAELPEGYAAAMRATGHRQIALAGVRTALVLEPLLTVTKKAA